MNQKKPYPYTFLFLHIHSTTLFSKVNHSSVKLYLHKLVETSQWRLDPILLSPLSSWEKTIYQVMCFHEQVIYF